jgi:mRNA interferase MazF
LKRGDIYLVDFEPGTAGEPAHRRPAVLITNNAANLHLPHLVVAPISGNTARQYPFDVLLPAGSCGLPDTSRVQLNYLRGLNRTRLSTYLGSLTPSQLADLDHRLRLHLGLD